MTETKMISEREAVLQCRKAFEAGACDTTWASRESARCEAARRYPLPKVTRPRVVGDPHDGNTVQWRIGKDSAGAPALEYMIETFGWPDGQWTTFPASSAPFKDCAWPLYVTAKRLKAWAFLVENPTEEVEDDSDV